jgi:hypothetical protein
MPSQLATHTGSYHLGEVGLGMPLLEESAALHAQHQTQHLALAEARVRGLLRGEASGGCMNGGLVNSCGMNGGCVNGICVNGGHMNAGQMNGGYLPINLNYPGLRRVHDAPPMYIVDGFLTDNECDALMQVGAGAVLRSVVTAGGSAASPARCGALRGCVRRLLIRPRTQWTRVWI